MASPTGLGVDTTIGTKTKINWFSAITSTSVAALGGLLQLGTISPKYGGIALLIASIVQGFSKKVVQTVNDPATEDEIAQIASAQSAGIVVTK